MSRRSSAEERAGSAGRIDRIEFDSDQFRSILAAIAKPPSDGWSLEKLAKLLEVVGVVVAAVWAIHGYYTFRAENERLQIQQQQMAIRLSELDSVKSGQDVLLKQLDIDYTKGRQVEITHRLDVRPMQDGLHHADLSVLVTNKSRTPVEVSIVLERRFLAKRPAGPPNETPIAKFNGVFERGILSWKEEGYDGYVFPPLRETFKSIALDTLGAKKTYSLEQAGGPTGTIAQGEGTRFARSFRVRGEPGDWVGFVVDVFLNRGDEAQRWHHWIEKTAELTDVAAPNPIPERAPGATN